MNNWQPVPGVHESTPTERIDVGACTACGGPAQFIAGFNRCNEDGVVRHVDLSCRADVAWTAERPSVPGWVSDNPVSDLCEAVRRLARVHMLSSPHSYHAARCLALVDQVEALPVSPPEAP